MKNTLLFSALLFTTQLFSQAGQLDPSFGSGGKVIMAFSANGSSRVNALVVQPDQKIVAAGYGGSGNNQGFALTRYLPNGSPDADFGTNGNSFVNFGAGNDLANAVAIQSDGRIVAAGLAFGGGNSNFALTRLKEDGNPDLEFGTLGLQTTPIAPSKSEATAVAIQSDGKIVVAGTAYLNANHGRFALARYDEQGALDTTFGIGGIVVTDVDSVDSHAQAIVIQPDGKIVVAGYASHGNNNDFALLRYLPDGSLDVDFGDDGQQLIDFIGKDDRAMAMALQPDGKILLAGATTSNFNSFGLARCTAAGIPDSTFGTNGRVKTDIATIAVSDVARGIILQADGKIVLVGSTYIVTYQVDNFALARYYPDGTLDLTFNGTGKVTTAFYVGSDRAFAAALQADGRILAAGNTAHNEFGLARYLPGEVVSIGDISLFPPMIRAYPNPVQSTALVEYTLDRATKVSVMLYDHMGRAISHIVKEQQQAAGTYKFPLELPAALPAGEYLLILNTPQGNASWRVVK